MEHKISGYQMVIGNQPAEEHFMRNSMGPLKT